MLTGLLAIVEQRHPDVTYIEKPRKLGSLDDELWLLSLGYGSRSLTGYYLPTHAAPRVPGIRSLHKPFTSY